MNGVILPFPGPLVPATFLSRHNRFAAIVRLDDGSDEYVHLPDPGRLKELLIPGARLWLAYAAPGLRRSVRKTAYGVLLAKAAGGLISLDTRIPAALVRRALEARAIPQLASYGTVQAEARYGRSRIDFLLSHSDRAATVAITDVLLEARCLLEVKSVTLVENGVGLFPDAVTARGTRHLLDLASAVHKGYRAAVLFIVQREDAIAVAPHEGNDPRFAQALRQAATAGVRLLAYTCRLSLEGIALAQAVPVRLTQPQ